MWRTSFLMCDNHSRHDFCWRGLKCFLKQCSNLLCWLSFFECLNEFFSDSTNILPCFLLFREFLVLFLSRRSSCRLSLIRDGGFLLIFFALSGATMCRGKWGLPLCFRYHVNYTDFWKCVTNVSIWWFCQVKTH